jgi:Plasmid pRiA4b ORF-3-like protein
MDKNPHPDVYQLHVWIRQISPMIWRRFLIRSDSTLTDIHNTFQIAFGWSDFHLHRFRIRGQDYSVGQTIVTDLDINGDEVKLADFQFRVKRPRPIGLSSRWPFSTMKSKKRRTAVRRCCTVALESPARESCAEFERC